MDVASRHDLASRKKPAVYAMKCLAMKCISYSHLNVSYGCFKEHSLAYHTYFRFFNINIMGKASNDYNSLEVI